MKHKTLYIFPFFFRWHVYIFPFASLFPSSKIEKKVNRVQKGIKYNFNYSLFYLMSLCAPIVVGRHSVTSGPGPEQETKIFGRWTGSFHTVFVSGSCSCWLERENSINVLHLTVIIFPAFPSGFSSERSVSSMKEGGKCALLACVFRSREKFSPTTLHRLLL